MKKVVTLLSLLCTLGLLSNARAQLVPRTVLLEEGTNWSCPPCAADNPLVEYFVQSHVDNVIQIAYHPNWPGPDDPMYLNDPTDNQTRVVNYYGVTGVPSVMIDGSSPVVPGSLDLMEKPYQTRIAKLSPIRIEMSRSVQDTTVTVIVHVTAVADLGTTDPLVLRVAAVERFVPIKGPNGEPRYVNPMRQMLPSYQGTALHLTVGQTANFLFMYPIKPAYQHEKMIEVAFVQDDKSKEVFQAASTEQKFQLAAKSGESPVKKLDAATGASTLQIHNSTGEDLSFNARYIPIDGKDWQITLNGSSSSVVPLSNGSVGDVAIGVNAGTSPYTSGIVVVSTITSRGDTIVNNYPVKFIAPTTSIAFVDLSGDSVRSAATIKTMDAMSLRYVPLTSQEANNVDGWKGHAFSTVVMETNKYIITGSDKQYVSDYLSSGGHLLLQGGEIGFGLSDPLSTEVDRDPEFMSTVLHASYVRDSAGPRTVSGVAGDLISDPFANSPVNIYGVNTDKPNQPDEIKPENGATPIFYYGTGTSQVAGIRWDNGHTRLVYLAFGLQNVSSSPRQQIITQVLKWFATPEAVGSEATPVLELGQNYPNPFAGKTTITYSLPVTGVVHVSIMDVKGTTVRELVNGTEASGPHSVSFDATGLAKGTYFYMLHTAQGSTVKALTIE